MEMELIKLIKKLARENPTWGAPRIHGELSALGYDLCERTVSNYLPKSRDPAPQDVIRRWMNFIGGHRDVMVACEIGRAHV